MALEAINPEIVEVAIVEVETEFAPVSVVLPPWTVKVLLFSVSVPLPAVIICPLKVLAVKAVIEVVAKVAIPTTFKVFPKVTAPFK